MEIDYEKAITAVEKLLAARGYEEVERFTGEHIDGFTAKENGELAFVHVAAGTDGFPNNPVEREQFERDAAMKPASESVSTCIRYDFVSVWVFGEDRAVLRLHQNALGVA